LLSKCDFCRPAHYIFVYKGEPSATDKGDSTVNANSRFDPVDLIGPPPSSSRIKSGFFVVNIHLRREHSTLSVCLLFITVIIIVWPHMLVLPS
jgi:hypothetical protein